MTIEPGGKGGALGLSFIGGQGDDMLVLSAAQAWGKMITDIYPSVVINELSSRVTQGAPVNATTGEEDKMRGNESFKAGRYEDAVKHYSKAISEDPQNATYFSNRAQCYLKMGNFMDAEQDCSSALQVHPKNVKALLRRGTARRVKLFSFDR